MSHLNHERVLSVHHWTDTMFSFRTTRDPGFRFKSGQFTMLGIEIEGKAVMRAYSLVSANYEEELEFLSIKVQDGPLTSRLQHMREGDTILIGRKPTGTLISDNLLPGRRLMLLGTGTGLAPFMSIIKDPETYEQYEQVVLLHGCRYVAELAYGELITKILPEDEHLGEMIRAKLLYYPTITREPFVNRGRITDLVKTKMLFKEINQPELDPANDRVMLCGGPPMVDEFRKFLSALGFAEGSPSARGHFVVERAFIEK